MEFPNSGKKVVCISKVSVRDSNAIRNNHVLEYFFLSFIFISLSFFVLFFSSYI